MKTIKKLFFILISAFVLFVAYPAKADSLITTVNVGTNPYAIAVNSTTNKIYVANYNSDSVSVINGATNTLLTSITVGSKPRSITVNPITNRIFVANYGSDNVSVINGATDTVISSVAVGNFPMAIDINTTTNKIYVANSGLSQNVTIIDGATLATINVGVGGYSTDIVVNKITNKIYVVNNGDSTVSVINGVTNIVIKVINSPAVGGYIALNQTTNKLYLSSFASTKIDVINGATDLLATTITVPGAFGMYKPAVNATANKIYLGDPWANNVFIINGATDTYSTSINVGAGNMPRYVEYNPVTNKIYVANTATNVLKVFDGTTNALLNTLTAGTYPYFIGINQTTSKIYVANQNGSSVSIYDGSVAPVLPTIITLTPNSGIVGTSVTITGTNFGAVQGTSTVKFNGTLATITSWSNTSIVTKVPVGATTGNVVVTTAAGASNGMNFTVLVLPTITTLTPNTGPVGTSVTIAGTNFGAVQGTSTVKFNGTLATITSWSNTSIVAKVPVGATTGNVIITTAAGASNGINFTVTVLPTITTLTPNTGPVGTSVTIAGNNFGAVQGTSTVKFNGTLATITSWSNTSIVAKVPVGATTGNVVVTTAAGASNGMNFTVTASGGGPVTELTSKVVYSVANKNNDKIYILMSDASGKLTQFGLMDYTTGIITYKSITGFASNETPLQFFALSTSANKIYLPYTYTTSTDCYRGLAIINANTWAITAKLTASITPGNGNFVQMIVDEPNNRVFALDHAGNLLVISTTTDSVITTVFTWTGSLSPSGTRNYNAGYIGYNPSTNKIYALGRYYGDYNVTGKNAGSFFSIINGTNYKIIKQVLETTALKQQGVGLYVDTLNSKIYIPYGNATAGTITIYDGSSDSIVKEISTPVYPGIISFNPTTNKAYVLGITNTLILSTTSLSQIGTIAAGGNYIAVNSQTNKIYITNNTNKFTGALTIMKTIDGASNSVIDSTNLIYSAYPNSIISYKSKVFLTAVIDDLVHYNDTTTRGFIIVK